MTRAVYGLLEAGYSVPAIVQLLPELTLENVERAITLERLLLAA